MAYDTPLSAAAAFFGSKPFTHWLNGREAQQKFNAALLQRFDGVMKAFGGLGKLLAGVLRRR